ncbi:hypothetical protein IAQ61_006903 [Plenodomus lingam]|uniref:Predicted protein n=1 Tax=Leptosphaeria maculans (strain JN3 / isolate v23.1.3 / race Av1-4-5-6-7-8) TaxID=985895 RepID=E5ACW6_LEPMJ|nr:predicted protein [Plenodomus lingam JN3]KAH9869691.1 hypothetical protein IAQ61_006903 [Plenodomus lingam]CBY02318.1 predicted protein [Plenodomus lingam JN3]
MGGHFKAKAEPMISTISGPMDAKHVGGIDVTGNMGSEIDHYFTKSALEPDELPSHTFVATGKIEVPKRSGTFAHSIRRPSISLPATITLSRSKSISHHAEARKPPTVANESHKPFARSDSVMSGQSLRMRPSISRLRQRIGLDKEKSSTAVGIIRSVEIKTKSEHTQTNRVPSLRAQDSRARDTTTSSTSSSPSHHTLAKINPPPSVPPSTTNTTNRPLPPPPQRTLNHAPKPNPTTSKPPTAGPHPNHADPRTAPPPTRAIPNQQQNPIPFQDIMGVDNLAERMHLYKATREYWAYADHDLVAWTGRAAARKPLGYYCG